MNKRLLVTCFTLLLIFFVDGKKSFKSGRSSGAGRSTSRKTNYNPKPVPTSLSYPQASAPKPSLFGWQEKSSKNAQTPKQSKPPNTQTHSYPSNQAKPPNNQGHSYPSSQTGMSGTNQAKPAYQESVQKSSATQNLNGPQMTNNQPGHSYPASPGLSGSAGSSYPHQTGYQQSSNNPQGTGLSGVGAGAAPPPYPGNNNRQLNGGTQQNNNPANTYQHPPPPPPYSNAGPNYGSSNGAYGGQHNGGYGGSAGYGGPPGYGGPGGYGGHSGYGGVGGYNAGPQMPGYFGNYGNYGNKGFGGVSRTGSALTGIGIAGAGVGTILTGLALWNLARSTGRTQHTVIYDNRGQPVAVAPENNATSETDSILADLVNCSLTISKGENTEVLAIPCSIATSFRPDADVKDLGRSANVEDDTKCTVTVVNKEGREFMSTISCATLLNTAKENNVTEPPLVENMNMTENINSTMEASAGIPLAPNQLPMPGSDVQLPPNQPPMSDAPEIPLPHNQPSALGLTEGEGNINVDKAILNCTPQPGEVRDPLNPCFAVTHNITVRPLEMTEKSEIKKEK